MKIMKLITKKQQEQLFKNHPEEDGKRPPVVKIFNPTGPATWLIHSVDPEEPEMLFGLCDMGIGFSELGYVNLTELQEIRVPVRFCMAKGT